MTLEQYNSQVEDLKKKVYRELGQNAKDVWNKAILTATTIVAADSCDLIENAPNKRRVGLHKTPEARKLAEAIPTYLFIFLLHRTKLLGDTSDDQMDSVMGLLTDTTIKLIDSALGVYEETGKLPAIPIMDEEPQCAAEVDLVGNLLLHDPLKNSLD